MNLALFQVGYTVLSRNRVIYIGVWKCQMSPSQTYNKPIDDDVVKADGKIAARWQFVTARH